MIQSPSTNDFILKWRGDSLDVTLTLDAPRKGRAAFRTNLGNARIRRREIIAETERGETPLARAWTDIPMAETAPGVFHVTIPLNEVGIFSGKACFFPEGSNVPEWPEGPNTHVKVESADTRTNNSIYTVFPRQFGSFRAVARKLDFIMGDMGFKIIQTLPPFPVPTTYAVMGEYGCPFAATDFFSVDPAMAEFDEFATPLDQFRELVDAVHAREGLFFVDLPANHTGWASTLQTHHPDWFSHEADGRFHSPGAWGVKWADLVELDYSKPELRAYMADVFLFWCRNGVDGFRCDAGYMIPLKTWEYIVARVREEYPDTVFMLEGLGGKLEVTDALLAEANLDWAYSEIFQTYDRGAFEWYLPGAIARSEKFGTLVHFAETHDNDRLAKSGVTYARLRVQLAALLSWQGAWGMSNGVEWYATEKIDVHGKNDLNWGASNNMVPLISRLNAILSTHPSFANASHLEVVTRGEGNTLAVVRTVAVSATGADKVLILANLDCANGATIAWDAAKFPGGEVVDLMTGEKRHLTDKEFLKPGEVLCVERTACESVPPAAVPRCVPARRAGTGELGDAAAETARGTETRGTETRGTVCFHWVYPRDARRQVCVPENQLLEVSAPYRFRLEIVDPATGKTIRAYRSVPANLSSSTNLSTSNLNLITFDAPHYKGDGTACRRLVFKMTVYAAHATTRTVSELLIPPRSRQAKVKLSLMGEEVRKNPLMRTILSNGEGAAAQLRVAWGSIASQYDAMLAANPNPDVPSDRLNLWARTRCWLQREGYVRELDMKCVTRFTADPAGRFATWDFRVPCGMGRETAFAFTFALEKGNVARLTVTRGDAGEDDVGDQVRLVFRPDIEWRSFHATTKAYGGAEGLFREKTVPRCVSPAAGNGDGLGDAACGCLASLGCSGETHRGTAAGTSAGFDFAPYGETFAMRVVNGAYHHEPEWIYNVSHAEEAARGQDGSGDLYSPGWISADLKVGETVEILGGLNTVPPSVLAGGVATGALESAAAEKQPSEATQPKAARGTVSFATALAQSLDLFIVKRDDLKTVIAGYPWFLDWGRDTFIFMRGMIAAGKIEDSVRILQAFAAFEENGTLPNIIYGKTAGNRDTTDAQLWFIRCVQEVSQVPGVTSRRGADTEALSQSADTTPRREVTPGTISSLKKTCESIVDHYISGTPNGIHMDPESALIWSPSHFTWMDTNYPACTPRIGYPVEIQALWISALRFLGRTELAEKALASVMKYFKVGGEGLGDAAGETHRGTGYYDCLAAPNGEPAAQAKPEDTIRPNQLFLITLGVLDDKSILAATEELLVPGGVRSLNAEHPMYRGVYAGDEDTCRKPAYHNGTIWAWPFPLYAEALAMTKSCSKEVALQLLATAVENVNAGCLCHVSENADGDAPHAQKGCTAQAWSDSELLRVWLKLGGK